MGWTGLVADLIEITSVHKQKMSELSAH